MSAKKKNVRRASVSKKPKPVLQPNNKLKQSDEAPKAPADAASVQSEIERRGPAIVGIGASAGGLDAFEKLLTAMPSDSGIALVLVPHLDPTHESHLVDLLARRTTMPVVEVKDDMPAEANHVYIIPPNKYMTLHGGVLRLTGPVDRYASQTSIDLFLRSLADDQQEQSICIILSGTGSHGSSGLKAVKAAGGMAMVQDPATAEYKLMPQSAIATGLADYVLPVEKMPETLVKYIRHYYVNGGKLDVKAKKTPENLNQILALIRIRTKLDFRSYRKKTLIRRVERRMGLNQLNRMDDYLAFLGEHPEEVGRLSKDLLINVTGFFRDPEIWHALEIEVIAPLVRAQDPDAPLRVWSVGCATGEEPYSLGILLLEQLGLAQKNCPVQIFATDVAADALEVARQAIYPESISADVSPERLSRFFTRLNDSSYQVSKQLRETLIFARQNLLVDAPLSKLDLIVCRNLLMYLEPEVQKKIIALLHFALVEGGHLFLGSSETIGRNIDLFEPISQKQRIFRRIGPPRASNLQFPGMELEPRQSKARPARRPQSPFKLAELAQNFLLRRHSLACVVINRNCDVLHFAGPTEDYLVQPGGAPTHNLLALVRPDLEPKLRVIIQQAIRQNTARRIKDVIMHQAKVTRRVKINVEHLNLSKQTEELLLVSFQEQPNPPHESLTKTKAPAREVSSDVVRQLEQELETTREDLQGTIEELESSNEELKASNEEIMSMNEELQSANEELETSKEELQSLNEELTTVNNQMHEKVQELEIANDDTANLFNSTEIATIFLDSSLRIKRFTPATTRLFHLIATDVGRPISDIVKKFTDDDLLVDARQVPSELTPHEKEVRTEDGRWYFRRIVPYRTLDDYINGVVITFVDITDRKRASDAVVLRLAAVVESSADAIFSKDLDGTIRTWNRGAERLYGYRPDEAVGRSVKMLVPEDRTDEWNHVMSQLASGELIEQHETERIRKDGQRVTVSLTISPIRNHNGEVVSVSVTGRDITEQKRDERELHRLSDELRAKVEELTTLLDILPGGVLLADSDCQRITANRAFYEMLKLSPGGNLSLTAEQPDLPAGTRVYRGGRELSSDEFPMQLTGRTGRRILSFDHDLVFPDGRIVTLLANTAPLLDERGSVRGVVGAYMDISEQKHAETALRDRESRLTAILAAAADAIVTIDVHGIIQSVNPATERMFGYNAAEMIGQNVNLLMPSPYREAHDGYLTRYLQTGEKHIIGIGREVEGRRKDGNVFPVSLAVSEIENLKLFTGILHDITHRKELERDVVEIASRQQRRIGEDLHDSVAQELTALNLLAKDLDEILRTDPNSASQLVKRMDQGLQRSQLELRAVLRGLLPVGVDSEGLMAALADLADRSQREGKVTCSLDCPKPVAVEENLVATHLYLIAQEAVHNAIKHGQPRNIRISLRSNHSLVLQVQCDGIGMPAGAESGANGGMGLHIMRNRAAIIGATLSIEPAKPTGTVVTCALVRRNNERKKEKAVAGSDRG